MAVVITHDDLKFREVFPDKDFDHWRQPESPKEGKPHSPGSVQDKSSAGLKDLSRLTRKRRCYLSAKGARLSSRKRIDDKMSTPSSDMKTRFARKGKYLQLNIFHCRKYHIYDHFFASIFPIKRCIFNRRDLIGLQMCSFYEKF